MASAACGNASCAEMRSRANSRAESRARISQELGEVLDAVNLMTYDYNGAWLPFVARIT